MFGTQERSRTHSLCLCLCQQNPKRNGIGWPIKICTLLYGLFTLLDSDTDSDSDSDCKPSVYIVLHRTFHTAELDSDSNPNYQQECIPVGCVPSTALAVRGGGVSARGGVCPSACWNPPPPCEQNDRRLWKHNLAATTLRTVITEWDQNQNPDLRISVNIFFLTLKNG